MLVMVVSVEHIYNNVSYLQHNGGPGYEHFPQGCDQLSYSYLVEYSAYGNWLHAKHKVCSDNVVNHMYNDKTKHSHTAVMYDITDIIDTMIQDDNTDIGNYQKSRSDTDIKTLQSSLELDKDTFPDRVPVNTYHKGDTDRHLDNRTVSDFNYLDKKISFINLEATGFSFIGPDREPTKVDSMVKLLKIADIILSTGVLKYQSYPA